MLMFCLNKPLKLVNASAYSRKAENYNILNDIYK